MRRIIEMKKAERLLSPYFPLLAVSVETAFIDYVEMVQSGCKAQNKPVSLNARSKATIIQNLVTCRIADNFKNIHGISAKEYRNVFGLYFKDQFFLRFKKFNRSLSPSLSLSKQTKKYESQQCTIPGFPRKATLLYVGYTFNSTMTGVDKLYISCRVNGQSEWIFDVSDFLYPLGKQIILYSNDRPEPKNRIRFNEPMHLRKAS
jgi:hypothetical protein